MEIAVIPTTPTAVQTPGNKKINMKKQLLSLLVALLSCLTGYAYQFTFDGEADNRYPIIIEVDRTSNGAITGRYAYKSTLSKLGRKNRASWLYIRPNGSSKSDYIITDSQGKVQEKWFGASFWREGEVNYFSVTVTNAKGKTFGINAHSTSKNTISWEGSYDIYSDGYRNTPPPISVRLTLKSNGANSYKGIWSMRIADDDDNMSGMLFGDVTGSVSNGSITLKFSTVRRANGSYECFFCNRESDSYPYLTEGDVIAKISKTGTSYKIQPLGKMKKYLIDLGGQLTIVKTK